MTYAPDDLLAIQRYCRDQTGQSWASLGIVGDTSHNSSGGYHVGRDVLHRLGTAPEDPGSDYSYVESQRDRNGLTAAASAFDLGGDFARFREVSLGIVAACQRGDARTRDIREVIYTPDGRTVRRWDRLGIRNSGDSSHLSHTHLSFHRDSDGRRHLDDNLLGLLRELLEGKPTAATTAFTPIGEEMHKELRMSDLNHVTGGASPSVGYVGGFLRLTSFWGDSVVTFDRRNGTVVVDGKRVEAPRVHEEITVQDGVGPVQRDLPDGCEWSIALKDTTHNTPTNETHTETFCVVETYGNRG